MDLFTALLFSRHQFPQTSSHRTTFDLNRSFIHKVTQVIYIPGKNAHRNPVSV